MKKFVYIFKCPGCGWVKMDDHRLHECPYCHSEVEIEDCFPAGE